MMMSSQTQFRHLKMQVQRKLAETLQLAENHFQRKFPIPTISYDLRGVKAGVAYLQKNEIKFNRTLLLENSDEFIRQVVPHELAHLIVYQVDVYKRQTLTSQQNLNEAERQRWH